MKRTALPMLSLLLLGVFAQPAHATGSGSGFKVVPFEFDPGDTDLVAAKWKTGLGCPSSGVLPAFAGSTPAFGDTGCPSTDTRDMENEGLLLAKSGPASTNASAGATILGVNGIMLNQIGYDIRKPDQFNDPRGSRCDAGSPKFKIVTQDGTTHVIGCQLPAPIQTAAGAWVRLLYQPSLAIPPIAAGSLVKSIQIVMDQGDTGPAGLPPHDFGVAILDNININGTLIGRGPSRPDEADEDKGCGGDRDHHFNFHHSSSRPETSEVSYQDDPGYTKVQSVSAARSISYSGTAVSFVQDALFNGEPGYVLTFTATDLSALSTPLVPQIGSYSVVVTGAQGVVYQYTGVVTAGLIKIHPH